jgi:hypothetical protein
MERATWTAPNAVRGISASRRGILEEVVAVT